MTRAFRLTTLLFFACPFGGAFAQEPERADQEAFIKRAAFAQHRLWLLADSGVLSSVAEGGSQRRVEHLPGRSLDLCAHNGDPLVVTAPEEGDWTLRRWHAGNWRSEASIAHSRESLL